MPRSSSSRSRLSPSMPSKQKFTLPGSRLTGSPLRAEWGICDNPAISLSRRADTFVVFSSMWAQASSRAAAMPTMAGMFSVPARLPRSWAPPSMRLDSGIPCRAYSTPAPLGPWNLWAERDSRSIFCAFTSMDRWPAACTASVWNRTPRSRHTAPISGMGRTEPISLLAYMMVTRAVSSRMASATCWAVTVPSSPTGSSSTSKPSPSSFFKVCRMA